MTNQEIADLVKKYYKKEGYQPPGTFEHRYDPDSSMILYSFLRKYKPVSALAIGTWLGGSTCLMMAAFLKNKKSFTYVASELVDDLRKETEKHCMEVNGKAPVMIGDIMENLDKAPEALDFLFIDTNHDIVVTQWIVEHIFPRLTKGAFIAIHDFAVTEENGRWVGKGDGGVGGLEETQVYMDMYHEGTWPFEKLYTSYKNPAWEEMNPFWESSFWLNK